ncbi:MAG: DUF4351 domain-containing protein [Rhodocyclaceae bacterium]|nr:DUF4351 domain-containing protein [Rhodocyclaceae bacterium]
MLAERIEGWFEEADRKGMQRGMQQGMQQGETAVLGRQMTRRFGTLDDATQIYLRNATLEQIEKWTDNILDAVTIQDVFRSR